MDRTDLGPRVLLVVGVPSGPTGTGLGSLELVSRALKDPATEAALLAANAVEDVHNLRLLMDAEIVSTLRVRDVLTPLDHPVFPETPLAQIVELMARRGLQAVPIVGEDHRVLGLVTAGEALRFALQRPGKEKVGENRRAPGLARDVLSRTVMCVSEEEELANAAQVMINKEADQLPVVRDGEIVGVLTRDSVLDALFWDR
jgi:CBS domain-containing protein